eukprot:5961531-Prymnesium_polylepis.1
MREDREEQRAAERAARDADYDGVDPSAERNAAEELERLATVPSGAHLPSDVGCGERGADGCGGDGGVPAPLAIASEQFGPGTSRYYEGYLDETTSPTLQEMADFALSVRYQHYTMNRRKTSDDGGWRWIQPKYEFWVPVVIDEVEHRPVYYWKEGTEFYHAGERAPPLLLRYLDKLNADFGLEGRHKLNSLMFIIDDEGWQHAPPHADGHRTGGFYDLSLSSRATRASCSCWRPTPSPTGARWATRRCSRARRSPTLRSPSCRPGTTATPTRRASCTRPRSSTACRPTGRSPPTLGASASSGAPSRRTPRAR